MTSNGEAMPLPLPAGTADEIGASRCPLASLQWLLEDDVCILKPILDDLPVGLAITDAFGRFIVFNHEARRILGTGPEDVAIGEWPEVYGCYLPDRTTPFPAERMPLARALAGEEVVGELMLIRNPRRRDDVWIRVSSRPLRNLGESHGWAVAVFNDVTTHRKAAEGIELLSRAVEQTADSVLITDAGGSITYVNSGFEQTTGYSREEVMGQTPRVLKSGLQGREFYEGMWSQILAGRPFRGTLQNRKKNGELYWAEQTITPILGDAGAIAHFVSVLKDITESRRQQEQQIKMRLARDVQQRFYAQTAAIPGLDVGSAVHPAEQTGGDYVDFIASRAGEPDRLAIAVGDVSGHGFDAALVMALTHAYVRSFLRQGLGLDKVFDGVNEMLIEDLDDGRYVTLLVAILDVARGRLFYASAGHVSGFVLDANGDLEGMLDSTGLPLGIFCGQRFDTLAIDLCPRQSIVLFTDGLTEAGEGEEFGTERVISYVRDHRDQPAQGIADGLYDTLRAFSRGRALKDDVSLVIVKVA